MPSTLYTFPRPLHDATFHARLVHFGTGIWLDWMAQGTMVLANLFHDNEQGDIFTEVDHGPYTFANNLFLSQPALPVNSAGGAYIHNLITGDIINRGPDTRDTPVLVPHETDIAEVVIANDGDHRMFNNILVGPAGFASFNADIMPCFGRGNVYTGASDGPSKYESSSLVNKTFNANVILTEVNGSWFLNASFDPQWAAEQPRVLVTTALLGNASVPQQSYTLPDNSSFAVSQDYFGNPRNQNNPLPGPLEATGPISIQIWPKPPVMRRH